MPREIGRTHSVKEVAAVELLNHPAGSRWKWLARRRSSEQSATDAYTSSLTAPEDSTVLSVARARYAMSSKLVTGGRWPVGQKDSIARGVA